MGGGVIVVVVVFFFLFVFFWGGGYFLKSITHIRVSVFKQRSNQIFFPQIINGFLFNFITSQHSYFILTGNSSQIFHLLRYCEKIAIKAMVLKLKRYTFMKWIFLFLLFAFIHILCKTFIIAHSFRYLLSLYTCFCIVNLNIFRQMKHTRRSIHFSKKKQYISVCYLVKVDQKEKNT